MPPRFFVNALTYSDGTRSYVISIKFYERTPWLAKKPPSSTGTTRGTMRASSHSFKSGSKGAEVLYDVRLSFLISYFDQEFFLQVTLPKRFAT